MTIGEAVTADALTRAEASAAELLAWHAATATAIDVLPLETPEDEAKAAKFAREIRGAIQRAEKSRKTLVEPLKREAAEIDAAFREPRRKLEELDRKLRTRLAEAEAKRRREVAEAERRAAEERRKAEAALQAAIEAPTRAAELAETERAREALEASKSATAAVRAAENAAPKGVHVRESWDFEVEDLAKVPHAFLVVDVEAVRGWLAGTPKGETPEPIEGLRFTKKTTTVIR